MQISDVTSATTTTSSVTDRNTVTKDSFLQLLITQLQNQDPLSPTDNSQFLAQLAQFSALEQMQNLNDKFDQSMLLTESMNNTTAVSLIGRQIRAAGDQLELGESGGVDTGYFLAAEAASVTVTISDEHGAVVRTLVSDEGSSGAHRLTWDGYGDDGAREAAGAYTFEVSATDADGADVSATSVVNGVVDGVTYSSGTAILLVDGREVPLSDVLEVYQE